MKRNKGPTIFGSPPEGWGEQPLKPFSFLLPPGNRSSFRVVPDTPTNTPKSLADSPGVTMVLETPEALMGESRVVDNPSGGPEDDVGHTSSALGVVKLRRRNMMSFLESDFSHKEDVSSELSDNDAAGSSATPKQQWLWSRVVPALGTPQSSRRRKSTMANIIVPSDLNDEDFLATKLSHIQQEEKSARARRRSSACSTPRQHGPANSTPEATKRDPQLAPTNTRARPSRTSGLGTSRRSEVMDRETRGRTTTTTTTSSENCNATILFNDEDLQLTPVHCRGQPKIGPDRHTTTTTPNTTPSRPGTSEDTEVTEDTLRRLQTRKSPLLQLRKFSTVATQKMVEELKNTPQRTRRGEGLAERLGGAECHPLVLHSTPQRKDRAGSTDSSGSGGGASLPSPAKDPSCVLKGVVAYVEVRVDGENRSAVIKEQLGALGAKVETRLTQNTTHVIFRDGSKAAFLRARDRGLHILSTLWVEACRVSLSRAPETNYPSTSMETYSSDIHIPKKFKRSMHVKDIEEDLKLVEARIRRRNKKKTTAAATTSPTDPIPPGYCTPRHRRPREDVNSPLYSIRHLLSPHLKESSVSCEEEEDEDGICTPLAKRLFKKLMSRQEAGRGKGTSQESVAEDSALGSGGGEACRAGSTSDNQSEPQESLKLRLEDSDSFSRRTSSEVVSEGDMSLPRRLSLEGDSLPRRLTEASDESAAVGRSGMSHGESVQSLPVRLGRNSSEVSQDEFALPRRFATSCTVSEGQGGSMESSGGGSGGGGGGLADSDSSGGVVEAPVVVRRRQSMRLRARVPESEGFSESEGWTTERNKKNKKNCINTEQSLASLPAENNTHRKTNGTKTNLIDETRGKNKMRQTTPLETTPEYHKKTTTTTTTNTTERALEEDNDIPASQIPFTNTQRTRRRLMDLEEEITPTQDLITPATPTNKRTGPYHHLLHPQASKTKRKRLSRELFAKKCIDVLTSTTTVPSTSETGATGATTRPTGGSSTNGSSSSTSDAKEHKGSSGDDSVFGEARIVMLPRSRRSTEEFKMVAGRPKPRGSVRGSRGRRSCPPGRFSSSSASGSSASSMCLTSLHSSDKRTVLPIIRKLRGYHVVENVDQRTSHVVCGEPRRTLNLLLGIARGCWVLDVSWVYRSLEANTWAPEEPFELASFAPGAKACRQKREAQGSSYQHTLFSKVGGVCVLDGSSPPPAQLKELLELCGATVVSSVRNARVVVGGGDSNTLPQHSHRSPQITSTAL